MVSALDLYFRPPCVYCMSKNQTEPIYIRLAAVGALITGALAIIQSFNAVLSSDYVGAGVLLLASALSFGFIVNVSRK